LFLLYFLILSLRVYYYAKQYGIEPYRSRRANADCGIYGSIPATQGNIPLNTDNPEQGFKNLGELPEHCGKRSISKERVKGGCMSR
jgi:hypothetical protein